MRKELGQKGEGIAAYYLQKKGYKLLTKNWSCKVGELDLVMQDGSVRVIVEVRLRSPTLYGEGLDTVAWQKQKKLIRAAKYYQQKEQYWGDIRFDVVSITLTECGTAKIEHIDNAFTV